MNKFKFFLFLFLMTTLVFIFFHVFLSNNQQKTDRGLVKIETPNEVVYKQALPPYQYRFPQEHYSHPQYKTEWWYYTGNLQTDDDQPFGYELTFFRVGSGLKPKHKSPWDIEHYYMTHFALTDVEGKQFSATEKLNRGAVNTAGAKTNQYFVWNENWQVTYNPTTQAHNLKAKNKDYAIELELVNEKPAVIHGKNGVSQKSACKGCASHYYSLTRMKTTGKIIKKNQIIPVSGLSWMDHEFGSNQLGKDQVGWDWFSIQLQDKTELMLYVLRLKDNKIEPNSSGTIVFANGQFQQLNLTEFKIKPLSRWQSPHSKGNYPSRWQISIPKLDLNLTVEPKLTDQELNFEGSQGPTSYWEGACMVKGQKGKLPVKGHAYVELTGYSQDFKSKI